MKIPHNLHSKGFTFGQVIAGSIIFAVFSAALVGVVVTVNEKKAAATVRMQGETEITSRQMVAARGYRPDQVLPLGSAGSSPVSVAVSNPGTGIDGIVVTPEGSLQGRSGAMNFGLRIHGGDDAAVGSPPSAPSIEQLATPIINYGGSWENGQLPMDGVANPVFVTLPHNPPGTTYRFTTVPGQMPTATGTQYSDLIGQSFTWNTVPRYFAIQAHHPDTETYAPSNVAIAEWAQADGITLSRDEALPDGIAQTEVTYPMVTTPQTHRFQVQAQIGGASDIPPFYTFAIEYPSLGPGWVDQGSLLVTLDHVPPAGWASSTIPLRARIVSTNPNFAGVEETWTTTAVPIFLGGGVVNLVGP